MMKVTLKNVNKKYGEKHVIKDLDLEINSGELLALIGPSGCGKSTMLFMLSGLETVTDGQIIFGEEDVTNYSADQRDIGLVFQNYALYPHMTVLQNVMFPLLNQKVSKQEAKKQAMEIIKTVHLEEHANKVPGQLSGGQQQRVAIARAIVKKPKILLLDEPLSNLDAKLKAQTILEIRAIQKQFGITTVFVTHDQQEALAVSDRIAILNDGNITQIGKPNELYRNPATSYVAEFIGSPAINVFDAMIKNGELYTIDGSQKFDLLDNEKLDVKDGVYKIGIRPEAFHINANSNCQIDVEVSEILGRDILVYTHINNQELRVIIRNSAKNQEQSQLKVSVDKKDILVFDQESLKRVD